MRRGGLFPRNVLAEAAMLAWALASAAVAFAHEEPLVRIGRLCAEIRLHPRDADLRWERGRLFAEDGRDDEALADFRQVVALEPERIEARVEIAAALQRAGRPAEALAELDCVGQASRLSLRAESTDARAGHSARAGELSEASSALGETGEDACPTQMRSRVLRVRARCLAALHRFDEADAAYIAAVGERPEPVELLAERVSMLERSGANGVGNAEGSARALAALDAWLEANGSVSGSSGTSAAAPPPAIELRALDLEERLGRLDAALVRVGRMVEAAPRKEALLVRRADLLERAGRGAEAGDDLRRALEAIRALPPARRSAPATMELERAILVRLGGND